MKVVIATAFYDIRAFEPYLTSLVETLTGLSAEGHEYQFYSFPSQVYISQCRNEIGKVFLEHPEHGDTLIMIDSDMQWGYDEFKKIMTSPHPVIGGRYVTKEEFPRWTYERMNDESKNETIPRCKYVPAGFLKIDRSVLQQMGKKPWNEITTDDDFYGEDVSFCIRLHEMGIAPRIDTTVNLKHWGYSYWKMND